MLMNINGGGGGGKIFFLYFLLKFNMVGNNYV